jgi:putative ABC transport system ATP-binding protein
MHETEPPVIRAENLRKSFTMGDSTIHAVDGISLEIRRGDFISILGPSGCGKSTLLNLLGMLDRPSGGEIYIDGRAISKMSDAEATAFRRKRIGFVFQQFNLINKLTVYENASLPLMLDEMPEGKREAAVMPLLERLGIAHRKNNFTNKISGGEMQRVAIARALSVNPEIIFADEPTGNLDSKSGEEVMSIFRSLNAEGRTIMMITHDKNIAKNAKRTVRLKDGRIESIDENGL